MKNEIYFENIDGIGNLYLEYVFLQYEYEPILFTCISDEGRIYLCLCCEIRGRQRWMISQSSTAVLKDLIDQSIDIADALCSDKGIFIVDRDIQGTEKSYSLRPDEIDELDLPEKGTMLRCDREEALKYLFDREKTALKYLVLDKYMEYDIVLKEKYMYDRIEQYLMLLMETIMVKKNCANTSSQYEIKIDKANELTDMTVIDRDYLSAA